MAQDSTAKARESRARSARLGFRVDRQTRDLVRQAAALERRSMTDFCLTALTDAAEQAILRHQALVLSDRDRQVFFDALVNPPKPNARLTRALKAAREQIAP
jgi:uncharacterized protein (DUF1778 family)